MPQLNRARPIILLALVGSLAACGGGTNTFGVGIVDPAGVAKTTDPLTQARAEAFAGTGASGGSAAVQAAAGGNGSVFDNFTNAPNPNITVQVNKYIWKAALEVLNFLPVESVDPFTGVIVTGFGTPPGGGKAYRATIYVQDGALDARSLHIALQTKGGGAVSADTVRTVEDAVLNRARQIRIADAGY